MRLLKQALQDVVRTISITVYAGASTKCAILKLVNFHV
jgi:hypothetical protein